MRYSLFEHRRDELILIDQRVKLTVKLAPSARLKRCVTFRIFEHYWVDTPRREPFEANWPAVSSSGRASGVIVCALFESAPAEPACGESDISRRSAPIGQVDPRIGLRRERPAPKFDPPSQSSLPRHDCRSRELCRATPQHALRERPTASLRHTSAE